MAVAVMGVDMNTAMWVGFIALFKSRNLLVDRPRHSFDSERVRCQGGGISIYDDARYG
jgi:hypothetical protein